MTASTVRDKSLQGLRGRLAGLGRRRTLLRWGTAFAGWALAIVGGLVAVFLLDWGFALTNLQRLIVLGIYAGWILFAFQNLCRPWLTRPETELELALLVEKQQGMAAESDLIAALQFAGPQSETWGSANLRNAVISYVAELSQSLNVFEGFRWTTLINRGGALTALLLGIGIAVSAQPAYAQIFLYRLLFLGHRYPSATVFERVVINGQEVYALAQGSPAPREIRLPFGQPAEFQVFARGWVPSTGEIRLRSLRDGQTTKLVLQSTAESGTASESETASESKTATNAPTPNKPRPGRKIVQQAQAYTAKWERLADPLEYVIELGDTWTDPARLIVIPLPAVDMEMLPSPPPYAPPELVPQAPPGARQIAVLEGSKVGVRIRSSKPLKMATLTVEDTPYPLEFDAKRQTAVLPAKGTPFASVLQPLRFEIQVEDDDGLKLLVPLEGLIRLEADRRPRVSALVRTEFVLPGARPKLQFGARDDFGLAALKVHRKVIRQSGDPVEDIVDIPRPAQSEAWPKLWEGQFTLDLNALKLEKGDQVKISLEAVDYRGENPGQAALSDPWTLQVTDERGVLAAMAEQDERSARQLDEIIRRQLGIGDQ